MSLNPATDYDPDTKLSAAQLMEDLHFLIADYLPEAQFYLGGALRFDTMVVSINNYMREHIKVRQFKQLMGVMPCRWSLSWHRNSNDITDGQFCHLLELYAANNIGLMLCFDNPYISDEMLEDAYGLGLVEELYKRDRLRKNSLCVANDKLCDKLKALYPKLSILSHPNRVIVEPQRRSAKLYQQMLSRYDMVSLHPADGARKDISSSIAAAGEDDVKRIMVTLNDSCLRTCPARREHLQALAGMRAEPYQNSHRIHEAQIVDKVGCKRLENFSKQSAVLTYEHRQQLYELGYRHFAFQAQQYKSPFTLASDMLSGLFTKAPEHSNKVATISANILSALSMTGRQLKSGMIKFKQL